MPCKKPVDVLFLLRAGEQFEDMKTFVKAFINTVDIGKCGISPVCPVQLFQQAEQKYNASVSFAVIIAWN